MNKVKHLEVANVRYRRASRIIARFSDKLSIDKWIKPIGAAPSQDELFALSLDTPLEDSNSEITTYALPASVVYFNPSTMTVDSVGSGRTVEEALTRQGDVFSPSLPVDYYRGVWFDGVEAYWTTHWLLSGNNVIPNSVLIAGTEVIGRYVVV